MKKKTFKESQFKLKFSAHCAAVLFLICSSCVTQIESTLTSFERQLVVEGGINNLPGPYRVVLNYTGDILGQKDRTRIPISSASVSIEEEEGPTYFLTERSPGIYETDDSQLQGEIGKSYRLNVSLAEGMKYQSDFASIPEIPIVSDTEVQYQIFVIPNATNALQRTTVQQHLVSATITNNQNKISYYKFEAEGARERLIRPILPLPPPEGCDEFFYGPSADGLTLNCWQKIGTVSNGVRLLSTEFFNSSEITTDVLAIPFNDRGEYRLKVNVKAINAREYNFWNVINELNTRNNDLFDPPLESIIGNVVSLTDENEVVTGYFSTQSIAQQNVCISRIDEESTKPVEIIFAQCFENCVTLFPNSSWDVPEEFNSCD